MDSISSNSYFNPAQIYQQHKAPVPQHDPVAEQRSAPVESVQAIKQTSKIQSDFSSMFGDDQLSKLQGNLEAVAKLAEKALKRFEV